MKAHTIKVSVRIRPPRSGLSASAVEINDHGDILVGEARFAYAAQVVCGSDQAVAYDAIALPLLSCLKEGFSCTLLAYGQTGSGKTHTMFGPAGALTEASLSEVSEGACPTDWGILPRAVFMLLQSSEGTLTMHASAIEIYQDDAYDLLDNRRPLQVGSQKVGRQLGSGAMSAIGAGGKGLDAHAGVHPRGCRCGKCWKAQQDELKARLAKRDAPPSAVSTARSAGLTASGQIAAGVHSRSQATGSQALPSHNPAQTGPSDDQHATVGETLWPLSSPADIARLARTVECTRSATGHALNERSSRSHCLVHVHVIVKSGNHVSRQSLLFVDLAGSERIAKSRVSGVAASQARSINGSLTALGRVIEALGKSQPHVPYRDSTLTMLLRSSFGGRSCTSVVINVADDVEHLEETICSLQFGQRLSVVKNAATVVKGEIVVDEIRSLEEKIAEMRPLLEQMQREGLGGRFGDGIPANEKRAFEENSAHLEQWQNETLHLQGQLTELKAREPQAIEKIEDLANRIKQVKFQADNMRDIILRQRSIKGFWFPPTPGFLARQAELRELEARLQMLL